MRTVTLWLAVIMFGLVATTAHAQRGGRGLRGVVSGVRAAVGIARQTHRIGGGGAKRVGRRGGGSLSAGRAAGLRSAKAGSGARRVIRTRASSLRTATKHVHPDAKPKPGASGTIRTGGDQQSVGPAAPPQAEPVSQEQRDAVKREMMAMVQGGWRPAPDLMEELATRLAEVMAHRKISGAARARLMSAVGKALNESWQANQALAALSAVLADSGVGASEAQAVVDDLKALADRPAETGKADR